MYYKANDDNMGAYKNASGGRVALMETPGVYPASALAEWTQAESAEEAAAALGLTYVGEPKRLTEAEMQRVAELKQMLADTDYVAAKLAEVDGEERTQMLADYAEVLANRQSWREEIRSLQNGSTDNTSTNE